EEGRPGTKDEGEKLESTQNHVRRQDY
ncbi:unnamed protein product, partial [Rotaria sp. Silwood1]